jgi:hypothetical protein
MVQPALLDAGLGRGGAEDERLMQQVDDESNEKQKSKCESLAKPVCIRTFKCNA